MSIVTPERPADAPASPAPPRPRHTWHTINSLIALGAAVLGVIALTRDPATKTVQVPAPTTAPATVPSEASADPGPVVGVPSDAERGTGGVPSDKYADRIPAYQYDVDQQAAPSPSLTPRIGPR